MNPTEYNEDYYERGKELGISGYNNYRWLPELTIPMARVLINSLGITPKDTVLDFGCAKGYLVKALQKLGRCAYGADISEYAISQAPEDVRAFLFQVDPDGIIPVPNMPYDWLIGKDVLEHNSYEELSGLLENLATICLKAFFVIPLGEDGEYVIPDYENDVSHVIREPLNWWTGKLVEAGFEVLRAQYKWPGVKDNWACWLMGNGFFLCKGKT